MNMKNDRPGPRSTLEIYLARGQAHADDYEHELAREYFDEAVRLAPHDVRGWRGRGLAWHRLREPAHALADYTEAIRLDPRDAGTFRNRGTIRYHRGEFDLAIDDYGRAIDLDPNAVQPRLWRAWARLRREDVPGAIQDFTQALELQPDRPDVLVDRAKALLQGGSSDAALADLTEALRLDPRLTDALEKRSELLRARGDGKAADLDVDLMRQIHRERSVPRLPQHRTLIPALLREHFRPIPIETLLLTERVFPPRMRADLQRAMESLFRGETRVRHFSAVKSQYGQEAMTFAGIIGSREGDPPIAVPAEYEEVDIGEESPVRCPKAGLWLLEEAGDRFAVLLTTADHYGRPLGMKFELAAVQSPAGIAATQRVFKQLEDAVLRSESYRGKVLSLDPGDGYSGRTTGLHVHKLRGVSRDQVILPRKTVDLLDRNVLGFSERRKLLGRFGQSTKKGILLYGPPGTGKTHTIHYLIGALGGHTTFLITAGQMGLLADYMTLARLLQPSIVVIEDVDLIARDRQQMDNVCSESLLNLLLNEMDGLKPDTDVFFILTTNRPESLEAALASRPGRIDQAIEYPLPDAECRKKLVHLYSQGLSLSQELITHTVSRTQGVSASFIRELMRRAAQFHLERGGSSGELALSDVDSALDELLVTGGRLNRKLLGAENPI